MSRPSVVMLKTRYLIQILSPKGFWVVIRGDDNIDNASFLDVYFSSSCGFKTRVWDSRENKVIDLR